MGFAEREPPSREGFVPFAGHRTWYRIVGDEEDDGKLPLLCLHGGPGATWHHLEPYAALAEGRRVVFYDQLGCGNSAVDEAHDPSLWTLGLYLEEIDTIRESLGLTRCHVLGHSWGGMLGMAYAAKHPAGLTDLVVESSPASVPFWLTELERLRAELPAEVEATLRRHEREQTTEAEEYEVTMMVFYDRHVCRIRPWPDWLRRTFEAMAANREVYLTMNGPSEFPVIGSLKDFDLTSSLGAIGVPTLLFCGEYDEVTPATVARAHAAIPGSQFVVLEGCSHMSQAERPDLTLGLLRGWLAGVEASLSRGGPT